MTIPRIKGTAFQLLLPAVTFLLLVWAGCSSEEVTRSEQKAMPAIAPRPTPEQLKIDSLETVTVNLKQRLVKSEQDNSSLSVRMTDLEAKLKAEMEKPVVAPAPAAMPVTASYEGAQKAFSEKKYDDAIHMFQALLDGGIPEDLADNCHYWIGESYFGKKEFKEAIKHFETVFQYKTSEKKGDAYFMLGRSYDMLGDKAKAKESYEKVIKDYPTNNNVKKAKEHLGRL